MKKLLPVLLWILAALPAPAGDGRVEISQDMIPLTISEAGSYVVTENLGAGSGQSGITIAADHVAIDLNGFQLEGAAGSLDGIRASGNRVNLTVRNGTLRGWGDEGIDFASASNCIIRGIRVTNNKGNGILVGAASQLLDCLAVKNGDDSSESGLSAGDACLIANAVVRLNGGDGIHAGDACVLNQCVSRSNNGDGIEAGNGASITACNTRGNDGNGIVAGSASHLTDSIGYDNADGLVLTGQGGSVSRSTAFGNKQDGIDAGAGNAVLLCTAYANTNAGIRVSSSCLVARNVSVNNRDDAVLASGSDNRIERNHAVSGTEGFDINGTDNLLVGNSATQAGTEYAIVGGNRVGTITNAPDTAGPWDNFKY